MRFRALGSASLLALCGWSGAAFAQETPPAQPVAEAEELVVTALRGATSVQDTPAAVTVVSGEQLEALQITDVRGVQALAPSVRFSAANTSTRIFMRGIGSQLDFYWIPETSAMNFNGTYLPRFATAGAFYDLENVQVLPGPQGVLYGRGAGGGAVLVESRRPELGENGGQLSLTAGNFDLHRLEGAANFALGDDFAIRAAGVVSQRDGFQTMDLQSDDSYSYRLSALYEPNDDFSLLVWGTTYNQSGNPTAAVFYPNPDGTDEYYVPPTAPPPAGNLANNGSRQDFNYDLAGYALNYDFGPVEVEYTGSWLHQTEDTRRKNVGDQYIDYDMEQVTQALSFTGTIGMVDWIAGVDYSSNEADHYNVSWSPTRATGGIYNIEQTNQSAFAQATFNLTTDFRLVAGARYSEDELELHGDNVFCNVTPTDTTDPTCNVFSVGAVNFQDEWENTDLKLQLEYDLTPDVLFYGSVQTGYAPGSLNTIADAAPVPPGVSRSVDPQTLVAYTAGVRSQFADGRVTLNLEVYDYEYEDLLIQSFVASSLSLLLFNAPEATVRGVQLTSSWRPTDNDTLSVNVAYTHGRYGEFLTSTGVQLDGLQMSFTPDWSGTVAYDHSFDLASGASIDAHVDTYFASSFWLTFAHDLDTSQESYSTSNASLTYNSAGDNWWLSGWVKNIEDEAVAAALGRSGFAAPYHAGGYFEPPRTYGATIGLRF